VPGIEETVWCDGCGTEVTWSPVLVGNRKYCCQDCQNGLPCRCGERMEMEEERRDSRASPTDLPGGFAA
jgi:hypothetical protein